MAELLLAWTALLGVLIALALGRPREGGGLTLAYFVGLSLIHVPGLLAFLSADSRAPEGEATRIGFLLTLAGLAAFVAGATVARRGAAARALAAQDEDGHDEPRLARVSAWAAGVGALAFFVLTPLAGLVPSLTSLTAPLSGLLVIGLWLRLDQGRRLRRPFEALTALAVLPLLPLATMATQGFIGFGVYWVIGVAAFAFVRSPRRPAWLAAAPVAAFAGLSLFASYMASRDQIRDAVWREQAGYSERLRQISRIVTDFKPLDLDDPHQMASLALRLNQNVLVGRGVERHEEGVVPLLHGATVSPTALIPRALWPDKPEVGGSGDWVGRYTGVWFKKGTSVGIGQVLEFYMNFGWPGVLAGFFAWGWGLRWLDCAIAAALARDDLERVIGLSLPGIMLLQPGGSLVEILVAVVAAMLVGRVCPRLLRTLGLEGRAAPAGAMGHVPAAA